MDITEIHETTLNIPNVRLKTKPVKTAICRLLDHTPPSLIIQPTQPNGHKKPMIFPHSKSSRAPPPDPSSPKSNPPSPAPVPVLPALSSIQASSMRRSVEGDGMVSGVCIFA